MYYERVTYSITTRIEYEAQAYARYEKEEGVSFCPYHFDGYGAHYSDEPQTSIERIFDAFNDYQATRRWD